MRLRDVGETFQRQLPVGDRRDAVSVDPMVDDVAGLDDARPGRSIMRGDDETAYAYTLHGRVKDAAALRDEDHVARMDLRYVDDSVGHGRSVRVESGSRCPRDVGAP